jgi:ATP-binding cassette, subfamily C (CFTR/MRP), member 1
MTFFTWTQPIFTLGNSTETTEDGKTVPYKLKSEDMFPLLEGDRAAKLIDKFESTLAIKVADPACQQPVYAALKDMFWWDFFIVGLIKWVNSSLQFLPSVILNLFLNRLEALSDTDPLNNPPLWEPYVIGASLFFALSVRTLTENAYFHTGTRLAFQVRSVLTTAVYRKSLRLSPAARQGTKEGSIVQLMNVDAERFNQVMTQLHITWDGIYQIVGYMVLLTVYIGPASFAGLGSMLFLIPINAFLYGKLNVVRRTISKLTDRRVEATNEALQGVRAIKLYGWEAAFEEVIASIREEELKSVGTAARVNAAVWTFMQSAPILVAIVTLVVYAATSTSFTVSTVFTALTILNQLRFPLMFYPMVIMLVSAASVSLGRMEKFMVAPEVDTAVVGRATVPASPQHRSVASPADVVPSMDEKSSVGVAASEASSSPSSSVGKSLAADPTSIVSVSGGTFWWQDPAAPVVDLLGEKEMAAKKKAKESKKKQQGAPEPAKDDPEAPRSVDTPKAPVLQDISFGVPAGKLMAVVGAVGVGKSALCSALLGELHKESGRVTVAGSVAYCAQRSWILNATVEKNVLFSEPLEKKRYEAVIKACQLEDDMEQLPAGDQTEIGERGVNLSGGQKQRVSVARAAYSTSDIVILDDVLSALDPEVGARLFKECITGLMKDRTRLMVTNQIHVLEHCDYIMEIERSADGRGRVARVGTFRELMADEVFRSRIEEYAASAAAKHAEELAAEQAAAASAEEEPALVASPATEDKEASAAKGDGEASPRPRQASTSSTTSRARQSSVSSATGREAVTVSAAVTKKKVNSMDGKLVNAEEMERGAVKGKYYIEWLRAGGSWWGLMAFGLFFSSLVNQFGMLVSNFWVSLWASDPHYSWMPLGGYMGVFAALGAASTIVGVARLLMFVAAGLRASRSLHARLFRGVIYAPMAFFDTTPLGRVVARFSKDMDAIDFQLSNQLGSLAMTIFLIIGSLASIIFATPWFALAVLPILVVYWYITQYFRNISREVKRVDSVTRSPIYAHFGETLGGLSTIRAYGQAGRFSRMNEEYVDTNTAAWYTLRSCDRWLSVRLEILGNFIVLLSAVLAVVSAASPQASTETVASVGIAALAGFALSFSMSITSVMNWAVRTLAETENMMNSVERVILTADETPQEPREVPAVADDWASKGVIEFKDVKMRYRDDSPEVLHGVSFEVKPGEKVGIVGRSGSGKSTIMQVLFRIPVDRCVDGDVLVDGVPIKDVGLSTLRQRLSIIPQEAVMFSGTLRDNLDPAHEVRKRTATSKEADDEMWAAIEEVGLKEVVEGKDGLDSKVAEFGENWSAGQRQLLSLARALLRPCKILCLDEVSSSVDPDTDKKMHETIQRKFADRTILTIAHRLRTVIESDRILVMSDGKMVEFDHPHVLLSDPTSRFSSLVAETGASAESLRTLAKESFDARHK